MFLLLCMLLFVTYHMNKSAAQTVKLSTTGRYGSVESTALHAANEADDMPQAR